MRGLRLNGWQRIGIVLSIVWLIVVCPWIRYGQEQHAEQEYKHSYDGCVGPEPPDKTDLKRLDIEERCRADAVNMYQLYEGSWRSAALLTLIPILIAWLFAYGLVFLVRWIRRGFVKPQ